ncbi:hypothetical protein [Actinomadura sp. 3N407]|uniref:hypothetical protein n=1 Tax=Actinomadura sp. 3N407 TaxID=3457423 RepID=UPI003FCD9722
MRRLLIVLVIALLVAGCGRVLNDGTAEGRAADEFTTEGDVVGVVLSVKPYLSEALDCVLARVAPGRTSVWSPPLIQRMPGEGGCGAGDAVHPLPPPH